jgi:hypothetical protein
VGSWGGWGSDYRRVTRSGYGWGDGAFKGAFRVSVVGRGEAGWGSRHLAHGVHICCVYCLDGGDGPEFFYNQVEGLVGLAIVLH